jgi:hypothetical protein
MDRRPHHHHLKGPATMNDTDRCNRALALRERGSIPADPGEPRPCGRPAGHNGPCRSEQALARYAQAERERWHTDEYRAAARIRRHVNQIITAIYGHAPDPDRSRAARLGNHHRWHVNGLEDPACPWCTPPQPDPDGWDLAAPALTTTGRLVP